ncbi:uncharacterized protein FIBRA_06564 [Fibroporia radiculosa]|uniref:DUF6699 domain-containing protein n=1 Tax=Fibroporia radiculosa TaxID=599839 RepID=J4GBX1_9APHY|nr:uncharacterized protein FIBRA_06564 [Fibroporia radiculosa]CCM04388.1 predicted protein [Fibroporia radiculosa]
MLGPQFATWPENVSDLAHRVDTGRRWVPSPNVDPFPLPSAESKEEPVIPSAQSSSSYEKRKRHGDDDPFKRRRSFRSWLSSFRQSLFGGRRRERDSPQDTCDWPALCGGRHQVTPAEWRAYGYWARPSVNGVIVRNATPPSVPRDLTRREVEAVFRSLTDEHGSPRPENWVPRIEHPSLPPRPALWDTPRQPVHHVPPAELQLNPFLRHRATGRPPILFDLRVHQCLVYLGELPPLAPGEEPLRIPFYSDGPNGSQPATHPPVASVRITALADDTFPVFPWPITVMPHHPALPVLVRDVLNACIANFEERMTREEVDALALDRRPQVFRAYWARVRSMVAGRIPGDDDGLRRIDYLGDRVFFRGLEPAPDGDGFMLFMGAP